MVDLVLGPLLRYVDHDSATIWVETADETLMKDNWAMCAMGAWLTGTIIVSVVETENFYTIPVVTHGPYEYNPEEVRQRTTEEAPVVYHLD